MEGQLQNGKLEWKGADENKKRKKWKGKERDDDKEEKNGMEITQKKSDKFLKTDRNGED